VSGQRHAPDPVPTWKRTGTHCTWSSVGSRAGLGGWSWRLYAEKNSTLSELNVERRLIDIVCCERVVASQFYSAPWDSCSPGSVQLRSKQKCGKPKMNEAKLWRGVNWLGALMQKGVKIGLKTWVWCKFKIPPSSAAAARKPQHHWRVRRRQSCVKRSLLSNLLLFWEQLPSSTAKYNIAHKK
jgi:hypothetical protein